MAGDDDTVPVAAAINAVAVKLPAFWTTAAKVWFRQAEAQFHIRQVVADATKYYYVVGALDQDTASRIADILDDPPADNKYQAIKDRLVGAFDLTESQRAAQLLHMGGLGDRKPSQLMDDMLALAGGHKVCFLFKQIFLEQMPDDIRIMLADEDFGDFRRLATKADILWHARRHDIGVNKVGRGQRTCSKTSSSNDSKSKKDVPSDGQDNAAWCFFHNRWGADARNCRDPCSFSGNAHAGRQ
jgi:hypothetical protein